MFHHNRDQTSHTDTPDDAASHVQPATPPTTTLGYWQLTRGRLRSFEVPWSDEHDGLARLLRTLHAEKDFTLGVHGDGLCVTVYRCHRTSSDLSFQFLVTLDSGKQSDKILVEDLPDLLMFLDQLAPIIDLAMKTRVRAETLATRAEPEPPTEAGRPSGAAPNPPNIPDTPASTSAGTSAGQ